LRFALFKGPSQYGSLRLHVDQLAQALVELGYEARIVDMAAPDVTAQLEAWIRDPGDCAFTFGGGGHDLRLGSRSAYDALDVVFASLHVDHPCHHAVRLQTPVRRSVALFLDRTHLDYARSLPCASNFSSLDFLPPGANELPESPELAEDAFARRDIPLMFTGTFRGTPSTPWRGWPDTPAKTLVSDMAEQMVADGGLPVIAALSNVLSRMGVQLTPQFLQDATPLVATVQSFAEAYHRDAALRAIGRAGLPLHVWGNGWEPMLEAHPSFVFGGVGSFAETLHTLRRARVVLNLNNGFVAGGHERVFTAMCAGAAVFSDASRYYDDAFEAGCEIATFAWRELAAMPDSLGGLVADADRAGKIARAGAMRAQAEHRWINRAEALVAAVERAL